LRQRYYDANIGRFTRRDVYEGRLEEPLTLHKYLYANGNPVNFIDPSGLSAGLASFDVSSWGIPLVDKIVAVLTAVSALKISIDLGSYIPEVLGGFGEGPQPEARDNTAHRPERNLIYGILGRLGGVGGFGDGPQPEVSNTETFPLDIDDLAIFIFSYDTKELRQNMSADGRPVAKGSGYEAHHIVPGGYTRAQFLRDIITEKGIDINEAVNGARLHTQNGRIDSHRGRNLHSNRAFEEIARRIEPLNTDEAKEELRRIGEEMENGTFEF
jgi:hypothetical protein